MMSSHTIFSWKKLRWACCGAIIIFLFITYLFEYWSIRLVKEVKNGKSNYKLKARIYINDRSPSYIQEDQLGVLVEAPESFPIKTDPDKYRDQMLWNQKYNPANSHNSPEERKSIDDISTTVGIKKVHFVTTKDNLREQSTTVPYFLRKSTGDHNTNLESSIPQVHINGANCAGLFKNDPVAHREAQFYQSQLRREFATDENILEMAKDCNNFIHQRQYIMSSLSKEEEEFPIAYSILLFQETDMVERLLRAIYRPQNYYCIHVDQKSSQNVRKAMSAIASCFDNVFIASKSVDVQWGWFSVLEPELICMQDLWKYPKWKYFINLTGQEFPLKTNYELVKIFKAFNGANSLESTVKRRNLERIAYVHEGFYPTPQRKDPPPKDINIAKGSVHIAVQRGFVDFVLHNSKALEFKNWVKDTGVPDETFFASLNVSPQLGVPGALTGEPETNKDTNPFITRFKNWGTWPFDWPCYGKRVRMVCILSIGDLPLLANRPELFANKFYRDFHPLAYDCMEELIFNRTREEFLGDRIFNAQYYSQLDFVKHHVGSL